MVTTSWRSGCRGSPAAVTADGFFSSGAGHDEPEIREQLGDAAHAGAADPDEVNAARFA